MALPSGQLSKDEEREPITPIIPEGNIRTVVRLLPNGYQKRKLPRLTAIKGSKAQDLSRALAEQGGC